MNIRFPFEQELTYLRSLLWIAIVCLPTIGWINGRFFPEAQDPIIYRGALAAICLAVQLGSFRVDWIRRNFRQLVYVLIILGIVWINHLLFMSNLADRYVITTIIVFVGCSLVFHSTFHLKLYVISFMAVTTSVALSVEDPLYPRIAFLFQIYLLAALVYIALRNLIKSNSHLVLSGQYFKALVDNVDASCCLLDPKMMVVKFNERLRKRLYLETGKELKEGVDFTHFVASYERDLFEEAFSKALAGEMVQGEKPVYINNRQETWLDLKFIPIPDPNKKRSFVLFYARDIQAIKASQEKIQKQNEELQEGNEELDRFVYMAAHDLRAPLTSLLGLIDLARREKSLDALATYFTMMDESVQKLDRFIDEVMNFSKNSRAEVSHEKLEFEKLVHEILDSYQFIEGWDTMTKEVTVEGSDEFYSDRPRIEIILNNLISNAWKYRDPDKAKHYVKIRARIESHYAEIAVEDNGLGIEARSLNKIFDLFYRINSKSTGSGLGLYIVQETLDKLRGSILVKSQPGTGSVFTVTIPNVKPEKLLQENPQERIIPSTVDD